MNFKKTCKSVVSFALGTGMMFSGFAFNNKSNAVFPEKFYAENLEKYKNDPIMTLLLTLLREVQNNREKLRDTVSEKRISEARNRIVNPQKTLATSLTKLIELEKTCNMEKGEYDQLLTEYAQSKETIDQLSALSRSYDEKIEKEKTEIAQTVELILQINATVERKLDQVVKENGNTAGAIKEAIQENKRSRTELAKITNKVTELIKLHKTITKHKEEVAHVPTEYARSNEEIDLLSELSRNYNGTIEEKKTEIAQTVELILQINATVEQKLDQVETANENTAGKIKEAIQEHGRSRTELDKITNKVTAILLVEYDQANVFQTMANESQELKNLENALSTTAKNLQNLITPFELYLYVAKEQFCYLISYLMVLSISSSDETHHLCLDTFAENIQRLFDETELDKHIREVANKLFGDKTYERVVKPIIDRLNKVQFSGNI